MDKDIIFFSNFCDYSKEILGKIEEYKLQDKIVSVCVDDENIKLPQFLEAVPTIYLQKSKSIIVDDDILSYLDNQKPKPQLNIGDWDNNFSSSSMSTFASLDNSEDSSFVGTGGFASISYDFSVKEMDENSIPRRTMEDIEKERNMGMEQPKNI